jgi:2-oxoglutarate dehydrogenase E1 component
MDSLKSFYGPNAGYVLDLYERYKQDPSSVDAEARALFANWSPDAQELVGKRTGAVEVVPCAAPVPTTLGRVPTGSLQTQPAEFSRMQVRKIVAATALAAGIRRRGHLGARLDPLGSEPLGDRALLPETYGITDADLVVLSPNVIGGHSAEGVQHAPS